MRKQEFIVLHPAMADNGLTVMTEIFFPNKPFNQIQIQSPENILIKKLEYLI